jgi:hypothetical protein
MNRILQRIVNTVMDAFVGSGVRIDEEGRLCLPDGLCPDRVHRFIELVMSERFRSPREAMHALFARLGMSPRAVGLLDEVIDSRGDIEIRRATRHAGALVAALPEFKQIPARFRDFLVDDLALAEDSCETLEQAVVSARESAAAHLDCEPTWDAILDNADALGDLTRAWRDRVAAA